MISEETFEYALSHHRAGRLQEAMELYTSILAKEPRHADALHMFGVLAAQSGRLDAAEKLIAKSVELRPNDPEKRAALAETLQKAGLTERAVECYRELARIQPKSLEAYGNMGALLLDLGRLDESLVASQIARSIAANSAKVHNNLGLAYRALGEGEQALACFREAVRLDPGDRIAHSNLVYQLNYLPGIAPEEIADEHRAWAGQHGRHYIPSATHSNVRSPNRRLRIGYISGDFRQHSVGYFFAPLLTQRDRRETEVICYNNVEHADALTQQMQAISDGWRDIRNLADQAVAELVRADRIDILVDLSGHTARNRLPVFFLRPAPVQVTYLGYPNTTGTAQIDYRLTDGLADPPGMTEPLNVEALYRLPVCGWCYQPGMDAPEVAAERKGPVTFGCFNSLAKINPPLLALWARLLRSVDGSRLLLKSAGAGQASARQRILKEFDRLGVAPDRIELRDRMEDARAHLELYNRVDVALDTFPYHGTTTTCEALWMGVPVVTLAGNTHASRVGVSLLQNAGLERMVGRSPEEYLATAAECAQDAARLREMRLSMRRVLSKSRLLDARRFGADINRAFRDMWLAWCAGRR